MTAQMKALVLCIGNSLLLDDGFGPGVAAALLKGYSFPPEVLVLDRGVMGMAILADLRDIGLLLVIDALENTGEPPGTILQFSPEDLALSQGPIGAHDAKLTDVLAAAALLGMAPKATCLGIQVQDASPPDYQIGLTPAVQDALPKMVELAVSWLKANGYEVSAV